MELLLKVERGWRVWWE